MHNIQYNTKLKAVASPVYGIYIISSYDLTLMIHILNYCYFTVVVFAVLSRFFWPGLLPSAVERRIVNAVSHNSVT